jgi:hypothetical protein
MTWTLHPITEFQHFQDQWQRLNLEQMASPLLDKDFVLPLLQQFGRGNEILACYKRNNEIQAMAILTSRGRGIWETFQPSQAPLGIWIHSAGMDLSELLRQLIKMLPGFPLVLGVTQQDPQLLRRPQDDETLRTLDYVQTAKISIQGSFEEFWNARGKNLRQNMRTQRNNLKKKGVITRLHLSTAPDDVAEAIKDYGRLESAGWKAERGTAIHPDNAQGRFYQTMLEAFCLRNAGRIYRYWYNDRLVAMDLCIENDDMIILLKTTYDENLRDGTSPAFLLRQDTLQELFDGGALKAMEFYGGVMDWTLKWTEEIRTLYHVNHYRFAVLPHLHNVMKKPAALTSQMR